MIAINRMLQRAGVVWVPCQGCGRDWPFPAGAQPPNAELRRDFQCGVCLSAWRAQLQRGEIPAVAGDADARRAEVTSPP